MTRCEGCKRLEQERDNIKDNRAGAHVGLMPRHIAIAAMDEGIAST